MGVLVTSLVRRGRAPRIWAKHGVELPCARVPTGNTSGTVEASAAPFEALGVRAAAPDEVAMPPSGLLAHVAGVAPKGGRCRGGGSVAFLNGRSLVLACYCGVKQLNKLKTCLFPQVHCFSHCRWEDEAIPKT